MKEIVNNLCEKLNDEWALLTAGDEKGFNSMTISWGSFGILWFKNVVTVYVRQERYTLEFLKKFENFTITFFGKENKKDLQILGTKSGRDGDKLKLTTLTPKFLEEGVSFNEAQQTFVCKKIYMDKINLDKISDEIKQKFYNGESGHYMIIGEIEKVL